MLGDLVESPVEMSLMVLLYLIEIGFLIQKIHRDWFHLESIDVLHILLVCRLLRTNSQDTPPNRRLVPNHLRRNKARCSSCRLAVCHCNLCGMKASLNLLRTKDMYHRPLRQFEPCLQRKSYTTGQYHRLPEEWSMTTRSLRKGARLQSHDSDGSHYGVVGGILFSPLASLGTQPR